MATKAKVAAGVNGTGHGPRIEVPATSQPVQTIHIPAPNIIRMRLRLRGISPLIVCRMDEKVQQGMEDTMGGKAKLKKAPKDPEAEWNAARYVSSDGKWDGVHAGCFRGAIISAARSVESLTMTALKQAIFIKADGYARGRGEPLVRIHGDGKKFTNICRTQTGVSYPRHRPMYDPWEITLNIEANGHLLSAENLVNLVACAGQFCGVGEWRPTAPKSFTGTMGRFEVLDESAE